MNRDALISGVADGVAGMGLSEASATKNRTARPRLFIEDGFPVKELSIESVRERAVASALPPIYFLHVWWARRPLVASAAAVLGSLMPAWSPELAERFPHNRELATAKDYREWFLELCGIWGDPVAARKRIDDAKAEGKRLPGNAYGYKQAFRNTPTPQNLELLHEVLKTIWGRLPTMSDPTAGGGSIPFEALRYGLAIHANDLNPVASGVLRAGVELPARHGPELIDDLKHWGKQLVSRLQDRLQPCFQLESKVERVVGYIWARTIACPRTGKTVPLVGDWSLRRGKKPVAVRLITHRDGVELDEPEYRVVEGSDIDFNTKRTATWSRGKAVSPWDHLVIDGAYIRAEAQAGHMGEVLYAVAVRTSKGRGLRSPTQTDLDALAAAEVELKQLLPRWKLHNVLPTESVPKGNKTKDLLNYGATRWRDMFTSRQLLVHGCFVEEYRKLIGEVRAAIGDDDQADAVLALLAMLQGKALNWNSRQATWMIGRQHLRGTFDMHAFPFKKTFAEFEAGQQLYPWCLKQMLDAYKGIAGLLPVANEDRSGRLPDDPTGQHMPSRATTANNPARLPDDPTGPRTSSGAAAGDATAGEAGQRIWVTRGNAGHMPDIPSGSFELVCIDPPYYDNVMYAELSDYFYVWEKRTLGRLWPDFFEDELTDKQDEAVKNKARFAAVGRRANELAHNDYRFKMQAIFVECRRILRRDGAMCVMFTHKAADAWDGLGASLLDAGFTIETSWPMSTESPASLHQARQNSVNSTIFLVCRKRPNRPDQSERVYLSEIEAKIRAATSEALSRADEQGLTGVNLLLSTYGPALSVLSRYWPVYSGDTDEDGRSRRLRPEEALHVARAEVTRHQRIRLVGREVAFDAVSDFVIAAWDTFRARSFSFDDARRLALATGGLELAELQKAKILVAKSGKVTLLEPRRRLRRDGDEHLAGVNRNRESFPTAVDAVHTALYITELDGLRAAKGWLDQRGLTRDRRFADCLQALIRAVPRTKAKGTWNIAEAKMLEDLVNTYFPDIEVPPDPAEDPEQLSIDDSTGRSAGAVRW